MDIICYNITMLKHNTINNTKIRMNDNVFYTLRFYRDCDRKGKGITGIPLRIKPKDVNTCVRAGWLSEKPVGISSIYKITDIGHVAISEKEKYLDQRMQDDQAYNFSFDDRPRVIRQNVRYQKLKS